MASQLNGHEFEDSEPPGELVMDRGEPGDACSRFMGSQESEMTELTELN